MVLFNYDGFNLMESLKTRLEIRGLFNPAKLGSSTIYHPHSEGGA